MNKQTRRGFLGTAVAAIAGAATLAGGKTAEANAIGQQIPGPSTRVRYDGDTDLSQRCVGCGWEGEWSNETLTMETALRSVAEFDHHIAQEHDGVKQYRDGIWRPHDPLKTSQRIREARAEGYERAEFVQAKREESRSAGVACAECDQLRAHPVPLPDMFIRQSDIEDAVHELAHATAVREGISHYAAASLLYPQFLSSWHIEPT